MIFILAIDLSKGIDKFNEIEDMLTEENPEKREVLKKKLQKGAQDAIKKDKCLMAKRCVLVKYDSTKSAKKIKNKKNPSPMDKVFKLGNLNGCCPGQTGHHLVYTAMVKHCSGYNENIAPTVCAEGSNQYNSTHGATHDTTDYNTKDMVNGEYPKRKNMTDCEKNFTMECAIESGASAHKKEFGNARCSKKCIKQQLREHYNKELKNCKPKAVDKKGDPITPTVSTDDSGRS